MKQEQTKSHKSQVMRIPQKVTIFISLDGIANKILANPKSPWFTENCFRELGLFKRTQLHTTPKSCGIRTHAIILSTWLTLWIRFHWILSHPDFWNFVSQGTFSLNTHTHSHTSPRSCGCQTYFLFCIPCWLAKVSQGDVFLCNPSGEILHKS